MGGLQELPIQNIDNILKPLSNPMRQQLLILLANGPVTYTELLNQLQIESGSFYWHIGKMKQLISQNELKEYFLSDLGQKAYELLIFDGSTPQESIPFRPSWYLNGFSLAQRIYNLPGWILIQQLIIIILIAGYIMTQQSIIQLGTLPVIISQPVDFILVTLSIIFSLLVITTGVIISQMLYIQPDKDYFRKSILSLSLRVMMASSLILLPSIVVSILVSFNLTWLANNPVLQLILSIGSLFITILSTTIMVDRFLDLGLKDGLLIVLPPYYIIVLITFFSDSIFR